MRGVASFTRDFTLGFATAGQLWGVFALMRFWRARERRGVESVTPSQFSNVSICQPC